MKMRRISRAICSAVILVSCSTLVQAQTNHWITGYFPGWELGDGTTNSRPPLSAVDFSSMTVVSYFGYLPYANGHVDSSDGMNYKGSWALVKAAHAAGAKVVMTMGGWQSQSRFEGATAGSNLNTYVNDIVSIIKKYDYDGVDIDWEPLASQDFAQFTNLVRALRIALPHPYLLTVATGAGASKVIAPIWKYFDQINLMTYDLSFPSQDWITWYNSAVYIYGKAAVNGAEASASCNSVVSEFVNSGVPYSSLGIGAEFAGAVWKGGKMEDGTGVTGPNQSWTTPPTVQFDVPLYWKDGSGIMQKYYNPKCYHWDSGAGAPYLSINGTRSDEDYFISFDDSASIVAKIKYIKQKKLGGLILYELGWGYPGTGDYPLLEVAKNAFR